MTLTGKTAIITGASRGIGEATARHLSGLGATVILAARSIGRIAAIADEIIAQGGRALAVSCDLSRPQDVRASIETAVARTGRIDILVNNAGLIDPIARLADSDPDAWGRSSISISRASTMGCGSRSPRWSRLVAARSSRDTVTMASA